MKSDKVQDVYQELISVYQNLKAEVYVTEILEKSDLDLTDIDVFNQSTFARPFRRDVINFKVDPNAVNSDRLQLDIARNGLYDILPEGLFHEPVKTKGNTTSYKELRQKQKKQEKEARTLFAPLENEFFTQKVFIEQNERMLINEFTSLKTDFLLKFWDLDRSIPPAYCIKLLQLLPYVHQISGNTELTALSLQKIIGEKVTIHKKYKTIDHLNHTKSNDLLGVDFVLDLQETNISYPIWELEIGPIQRESTEKYLTNGITKKFITIFCDYFIPLEIDTEIVVKHINNEEAFVLDEADSPRIGLTTTI